MKIWHKAALFTAALFLSPKISEAQLINNGSFELLSTDYDRRYSGNIAEAKPWYAPSLGSPDLIKSPSSSALQPFHGRNYAGIVVFDADNENFREYIQIKLNDFLEVDKRYIISLAVALGNGSFFATNGLQIHLSNDSLLTKNWNLLPADEIIPLNNNLISNTKEWREFKLEYTAKGGERFFTLGNFLNDAQTLRQKVSSEQNMKVSYMLIDQVEMVEAKDFDKQQETVRSATKIAVSSSLDYGMSRILIPHVLTPNGDGFNDVFFIPDLPIYTKLNIYDRKGALVFSSLNYKNDWQAEGMEPGNYRYEFYLPDGNVIYGSVEVVIN
ncbi:MAG: gliding motility-associated C-terminal domain-containing protein [Flavobacteriales bacterium]